MVPWKAGKRASRSPGRRSTWPTPQRPDCQSCHNSAADAAAPDLVDVRDFHDGLETERVGIIYGGEDLSVTEGKKFNWTITQVVDNKTTGKFGDLLDGRVPEGHAGESVQLDGNGRLLRCSTT